MAGEELIYALPDQIVDKAGFLITILQAVGIFVIIYIIFGIINAILNIGKKKQLEKINQSLNEIKTLLKRRKFH